MEPYVARALMNRLLSESERLDLEKYETWLQTQTNSQGRYLTASELCQRYHLKPEPIPEVDTERMDRLLWIWQEKYDARYMELEGTESFNIYGDDLLGNLRHWEKFAEENYVQPSKFDSMMAMAAVPLVLMFLTQKAV